MWLGRRHAHLPCEATTGGTSGTASGGGTASTPGPQGAGGLPVPRRAGLTGGEYLGVVRGTLPEALDGVRPDLAVYDAGSDPYGGDPLARYRLTAGDLAERELLVVDVMRERGIPLAMALSGGYSAESWKIHADAIEGIPARFDRC